MAKKIITSKTVDTIRTTFSPENEKAIKVEWLNEKTLVITLNMTGDNCPQCAYVSLLPKVINFKKAVKISIKMTSQANQPPIIALDLKKGAENFKYFSTQLIEGKTMKLNLLPETREINFSSWKDQNKGFKGDVIIFFE